MIQWTSLKLQLFTQITSTYYDLNNGFKVRLVRSILNLEKT